WVWHNRRAKDQIWSLMEAAKRMGGQLTEAQASAITKEASIIRKCWSADNLARVLGVTYDQQQALRLTTIGALNVPKRARKELRKRKDRLYQERRRRERGARSHAQSLSQTQPWKAVGLSRRTWYRHRGTDSSAGFASKEASGYPSSQTACTMVAERGVQNGSAGIGMASNDGAGAGACPRACSCRIESQDSQGPVNGRVWRH